MIYIKGGGRLLLLAKHNRKLALRINGGKIFYEMVCRDAGKCKCSKKVLKLISQSSLHFP